MTGLGSFVGPFVQASEPVAVNPCCVDFFLFPSVTSQNIFTQPYYIATMPGHIVGMSGCGFEHALSASSACKRKTQANVCWSKSPQMTYLMHELRRRPPGCPFG